MKVNRLRATTAHKRLVAEERTDHHRHIQQVSPPPVRRSFTVNFLLIGVLMCSPET